MKVTLEGELFPNRKAAMILDVLMRVFSACLRYAYQRLLSGENRKELKKILQEVFPLNSRYADDAILKAQETRDSIESLGGKAHKVIWGTKRLFRALSKAKKGKKGKGKDQKKIRKLEKEWRDKRTGSLYSRGDKSKEGNLNLRIRRGKGHKLFLRINTGYRKWIEIPMFLGKKYRKKLEEELKRQDCCYSVEITRRDGRYFIHIILEEKVAEVKIGFEKGALGIDLNAFPTHIAWSEIDDRGNLVATGKIMTPHLYDSRANQRTWWRGEYARQLKELAQEREKALVLEDLDFAAPQKNRIHSRKLRRILSNFSYSSQKKAIVCQFVRNGIQTQQVWPGFTSIIGKLKYTEVYPFLSVHNAAAYVIARRGLCYKEKLTRNLLDLAKREGLVGTEPGESTDGRNSARPPTITVGWSVWRALRVAVLTGRSSKSSLRGRGP